MRHVFISTAVLLTFLFLSGCGGSAPKSGASSDSGGKGGEPEIDPDATKEERKFIDAARPFAAAMAARKYADAYALLSSHGRARMSRNQFAPEHDDAKFAANENSPQTSVSAEKFAELTKLFEKEHGSPRRFSNLHVHSLDPKILSGNATDNADRIDTMFVIGAMPKSIPTNIRKASLRTKVHTQLSDAEMAKTAKAMETTVEELKKDEDFDPYFNLKIVLIEESGELKVGYFECLPETMMD